MFFSFVLPCNLKPYENHGYVNDFKLSFEYGGSAGYVLYGGVFNAKMYAYSESGKVWEGLYRVQMIGFGAGWSFTEFMGYFDFYTKTPRSFAQFEGLGRIAVTDFGLGRVSVGFGRILLPSGDLVPIKVGLSLGLSLKASAYVTLAYWDLIESHRKW